MRRLSILLLGLGDRGEFAEARNVLAAWGTVVEFADAASAAAALSAGELVPELIVVAEAVPGQVTHAALENLRRLAPLARVVGLLGSWCEGEMRSGTPWPGVARTYWHQWPTRCRRELGRLAAGVRCGWMLPPTATEEERLLADLGQQWPRRQGLVVISARWREMAEWLWTACRSRGFATVWQRPPTGARVEGATAAIFDGADLGPEECRELRRLAEVLRPAPVIALSAFPRADDRQRALASGAATILSKPLALDDLFCELERIAPEATLL